MGETQFTRIASRWEGYYAEDVQCKFCLHYSGYKKHGCTLTSCLYENEIACFEAPVDCLSHQTLCKQGLIPPFDGWRLSLGGTAIGALEHFLKGRPEVTQCLVCTDNDEAGELAAAKIAKLPGITTARAPPLHGKDWSDTLKLTQTKNNKIKGKIL